MGVIPSVEVTITNELTNIMRSVVSNTQGEYVFVSVDPGTFTITTVLKGFKTVDRPGIHIGTQQFLVMDLALGDVSVLEERITVTGRASLIETASASQGGLFDHAALQALPFSGRAVFLAGALIPTVVWSGDPAFTRPQDQTNASRDVDGRRVPSRQQLHARRRPDHGSLEPPRRPSDHRSAGRPQGAGAHVHDAEMGRTGGGVFNATMRSGTNNYHGTTFFQTRPVWSQVNNYFAQKAFDVAGDPRNAKQDTAYCMGGLPGPQYVVSADGMRFLMNTLSEDVNISAITVILNWKGKP